MDSDFSRIWSRRIEPYERAQRCWSDAQHALSLPSLASACPQRAEPCPRTALEPYAAALSEPRHTLGLPLSYKRSPLQTSDAMPSSLTPACPLSSSSRRALSGIGHASSSMPLASGGPASSGMPSVGSVMPHPACPQPDRPRPALSWIALGQPSAGSPCPSCACLSDAPPLELLKVSRHLPSLSPQPPRAPALQAMSACPQSEGELTYLWHSERAPCGV